MNLMDQSELISAYNSLVATAKHNETIGPRIKETRM
jgi:hypothetical protein